MESKTEQEIGEMVSVKIDKPVYEKLEVLAKQKNCDIYYLLTDMILEKIKEKPDQERMNKIAEVMGGQMITVNVELFEPYVKFAKEYMEFFNVKDSFEIFCMRLIYDELNRLHNDLTEFVHNKDGNHFIVGTDWYNKNPHVACTSDPGPDDEE